MASPERIYWDSCAWLALINREPDRVANVEAIYVRARTGSVELWFSTLCIVEANRLAAEMGIAKPIPPESLLAVDRVLFQPLIKLISMDREIAKFARLLVRETPGLTKKADAIHLACKRGLEDAAQAA